MSTVAAWSTIVAAAIAAIVATIGYTVTARSKLLEARRETYAKALEAVSTYQKLPHRIRRRSDSTSDSRKVLGAVISGVQCDMDYYQSLLALDSEKVAKAYYALVQRSRDLGADFRQDAWKKPPAASDELMSCPESYRIDDEQERSTCQLAMRRRLKMLPFLGRT